MDASSTVPARAEPAPFSGGTLALLTVGLALGTFMEVLDTSIANVAVPTISGNLGVANSEGTWVISSYSVASAIAVPLTGWLARRVGEVRLFTISVLLFTIASAACGFASNFETLIAFRLVQGLVSGPMVPLSQTILMRSYPPAKRGLALGLWAMTVIVAPIFGPVMGGWITDNYSWPWIFYINVPIGLFSGICAYLLLRGRETKTTKQRIDAVGLALLVIGVSCLQMMLDFGKDRDWFNSTFIVTLAIVAVVSLAFMLVWEATEKEPVVDLSLFRDRNFALGAMIISFGFMAFFGSVVIFPLWLQTVMGYTAGLAGLANGLGRDALVRGRTPVVTGYVPHHGSQPQRTHHAERPRTTASKGRTEERRDHSTSVFNHLLGLDQLASRFSRRAKNQRRMVPRVIADLMSCGHNVAHDLRPLLHIPAHQEERGLRTLLRQDIQQVTCVRIVRPIVVGQRQLLRPRRYSLEVRAIEL